MSSAGIGNQTALDDSRVGSGRGLADAEATPDGPTAFDLGQDRNAWEPSMSKIALFIDFENVGYRRKLDLGRLIGDLQKRGSLSIKRA